jgi:hypothetical protein
MTCRCFVRRTTGSGCLLTGGRGHASVAVFQKVHWHGSGLWHTARQLTVHARSTAPLTLAIALDFSNCARCGVWRGITCGGALAFATSFHHVLEVHV